MASYDTCSFVPSIEQWREEDWIKPSLSFSCHILPPSLRQGRLLSGGGAWHSGGRRWRRGGRRVGRGPRGAEEAGQGGAPGAVEESHPAADTTTEDGEREPETTGYAHARTHTHTHTLTYRYTHTHTHTLTYRYTYTSTMTSPVEYHNW